MAKNKKNRKRVDLKNVLDSIYCDTINLETTCDHKCECCKIAMPSMNYCEFMNLISEIWDKEDSSSKINIICTSLEYFFRNQFEKFGREIFIKPCMILSDDGQCKYYSLRPLNCRLYGLWPNDIYTKRVDLFENAYKEYLPREEIPLNKQCPFVKRVDDSVKITQEIIDGLFNSLDNLDKKIGDFSDAQIKAKENYRSFHDWVLLKIFGEDWLSNLTSFMLGASREIITEQIEILKNIVKEKLGNNLPDIE